MDADHQGGYTILGAAYLLCILLAILSVDLAIALSNPATGTPGFVLVLVTLFNTYGVLS